MTKRFIRRGRLTNVDLNTPLRAVTASNVHREIKTGEPVGREVW